MSAMRCCRSPAISTSPSICICPPARWRCWGDRDELVQVFENLIENACKYGQEGKVVEVSLLNEPGQAVEVIISDRGPGIPAEHVPRLTERFYRVNVEDSRSKKGTGLGLAIVKHILTRYRARLIVKSEVGKGTDSYRPVLSASVNRLISSAI